MMAEPDTRLSPLQIALQLAAEGFYVFPLVAGGKMPAVSSWQLRASNNREAVERMFTKRDPVLGVLREPDYNVGIYTGRFKDGLSLATIDVDVKGGRQGPETLGAIDLLHGTPGWLDTRSHSTPSGGTHYLFATKEPSATTASRLGPGVDTRGVDGYIVGPGSVIDGVPYRVVSGGAPKLAPAWLLEMIGKPTPRTEAQQIVAIGTDSKAQVDRGRSYLETAEVAVEGQGGDLRTIKVANKLGDLGLSSLTALELMDELWNPRCEPPWDFEELSVKVDNAYRYRKRPLGVADPEADFDPIPDEPGDQPAKRKLPIEVFGSITVDFSRTALVEGWLDEKAMSVMYGQSNVGKTFVAMGLAYSVAAGVEWAGCKVSQGAVVYLAAEAGNSARLRLLALEKRYGRSALPFGLIPSGVDLLKPGGDWKLVVEAVRDFEAASGIKVRLLVIDTLSRVMAGGNENAPDDMGALVRNLDRIRSAIDAHLMAVHHSGKDQARGARGHSLLRAATDSEIEVAEGVVRATKQRDMEMGKPVSFRLEGVAVGEKPDGTPVGSAVCVVGAGAAESDFADLGLTAGEQEALDALETALREHGKPLMGRIVVEGKIWQRSYENRNGAKNAGSVFRKHRSALVRKLAVEEIHKNQWVST